MHRIAPIARTLLGLAFLTFGLNFFIPFLPAPNHPMPPEAGMLAGGLLASGLFTFIKAIEVAAGLALVANRAVPLALALLAPILVGINGFHLGLGVPGAFPGLALLALELLVAWSYRSAFAPMLRLRTEPDPLVGSAPSIAGASPSPAR